MAPRRLPLVTLALIALAMAAACSATPTPSGTPGPSPTASPSPGPTTSPAPTPTAGGELSPAQLRYALLEQFSPISWCDPDFYPIQHQDEQKSADEHWAEIVADTETYGEVISNLGIDPARDPASLDASERLAAYRQWKLLNAVALQTLDVSFAFDLISETNVGLSRGIRSAGTIDAHGVIDVALQEQSNLTACPICLSRGTLIDTPDGPVAVEKLRVGDMVWTLGADGSRVSRPLARVGSTAVPVTHHVVHLVLDDRREVWVSPGHPTADGRAVGDLAPGDQLDGALVVSAERVAYAGGATFDVLPDSPRGVYWANGVLLGSTLR